MMAHVHTDTEETPRQDQDFINQIQGSDDHTIRTHISVHVS